jgi:hypothetical protein
MIIVDRLYSQVAKHRGYRGVGNKLVRFYALFKLMNILMVIFVIWILTNFVGKDSHTWGLNVSRIYIHIIYIQDIIFSLIRWQKRLSTAIVCRWIFNINYSCTFLVWPIVNLDAISSAIMTVKCFKRLAVHLALICSTKRFVLKEKANLYKNA